MLCPGDSGDVSCADWSDGVPWVADSDALSCGGGSGGVLSCGGEAGGVFAAVCSSIASRGVGPRLDSGVRG